MPKLTECVKTAEAAEMFGVAQNTLCKWGRRGDIPMRRNPANGYRLFKRSDLKSFLQSIEKASNKLRVAPPPTQRDRHAFQDEFLQLLASHGIPYDPLHVFEQEHHG